MLNNIKKFIRKYFGFSESETNGFVILLPSMVVILFIPAMVKHYLITTSTFDHEQERQALLDWIAECEQKIQLKDTTSQTPLAFDFDPNLATIEDLTDLGFRKKTAVTIDKYRTKGGRFYKKEDLLKIYGISNVRVRDLWEHIKIPPREVTKATLPQPPTITKRPKRKSINIPKKNLNMANADSLIKIRGIGPVLSERIVKYRNSLGGFHSSHQLSEVYGLSSEVVDQMLKYYEIAPTLLQKLDINTDSLNHLSRHPYISYSLARIIIAYKQQHGPYQSIEELRKIKVMDDSLYQKLEPYLKADIPDLIE